jgi:hypothetical protein
MKKAALLATLAVACTFSACKKDDEKPLTKPGMLTAKSWRISADAESTTASGQTTTTDTYATYKACEKDDYVKFMTNKSMEFNEGETRCLTTDPQTMPGSWDLSSDETKLTMTDPYLRKSVVFDVVELTKTSLKVKYSVTSSGSSYTHEYAYASF